MKKFAWLLMVLAIPAILMAFKTQNEEDTTTRIFKYQLSDDSHVFDGQSPYWVEVQPGNECDPIDPTLPCTVTVEIGNGSGQYSSLDAFLNQFSSLEELMEHEDVTGKDE